jgi:branched-chain amino acid transport system substrate-binding protein
VSGSRPGLGGAYSLFHASFNAAFKVDANAFSYVAHAYDAAWVVFYGSVWSLTQEGGLSGRGIARGIRRVRGGPKAFQVQPLDWTAISDELAAGGTLDIEGASGPLDFDAVTEEPSSAIEIWRIATDGQSIELVTTIE